MNSANKPIKLLIADDHAVVRKGLSMVLHLEPDIEIIGEAGNGYEALAIANKIQPDVALLDLIMPELNGRETALEFLDKYPDTKIIILTGTEVDESVIDLINKGIDGYVLKEIEPDELKQVIRSVYAGETYLHPTVAKQILAIISKQDQNDDEASNINLTPRELEVLAWMGTAKTYRAIAEELFVTEETIRSHAKNILSKLEQPNRAQAVLAAVRANIIDLPN